MARCIKCGAHLEEEEDSMKGSSMQENAKGEMVEVCDSCGAEQPVKKSYKQNIEKDAKLVILTRQGKYDDPEYDAGRFAWFKDQTSEYTSKVFDRVDEMTSKK